MRNPKRIAIIDRFATSTPSINNTPGGSDGGPTIPGDNPSYFLPYPGHSSLEFGSSISSPGLNDQICSFYIPYVSYQGMHIVVPVRVTTATNILLKFNLWSANRTTISASSSQYTGDIPFGSFLIIFNWDLSSLISTGEQNLKISLAGNVLSGSIEFPRPIYLSQVPAGSLGNPNPIIFAE